MLTHKEEERHHHTPHAFGGHLEGVFQAGDRGENLRETNENVASTLDPNIQWGRSARGVVGVVSARAALVDIVLNNGGPDHGQGGGEETSEDTLEGTEIVTSAAEGRVDEVVADGDEDNESEGVEVLDDVIWYTVGFHTEIGKMYQ